MAEKDIAAIYKTSEIKTNLTQTIPKTGKRDCVKIYSMRLVLLRQKITQRHNNTKLTSKPIFLINTICKNCQQNTVKPNLTAHQKDQTSWSGRVYPRDARAFSQVNKGSVFGMIWICNVLHTLMIWCWSLDSNTICGGCRNQEVAYLEEAGHWGAGPCEYIFMPTSYNILFPVWSWSKTTLLCYTFPLS